MIYLQNYLHNALNISSFIADSYRLRWKSVHNKHIFKLNIIKLYESGLEHLSTIQNVLFCFQCILLNDLIREL